MRFLFVCFFFELLAILFNGDLLKRQELRVMWGAHFHSVAEDPELGVVHSCRLSSKKKWGFVNNDICDCEVVQNRTICYSVRTPQTALLTSWRSQRKRPLSVQDTGASTKYSDHETWWRRIGHWMWHGSEPRVFRSWAQTTVLCIPGSYLQCHWNQVT